MHVRNRQAVTCFACWLADTLAASLLAATCSCRLEISACRRCAVICNEAGSAKCLQAGYEREPNQQKPTSEAESSWLCSC